jgi:hypothetical protein
MASVTVAARPSYSRWTPEPQAPQRGRANLVRRGRRLSDAITGADRVQKQVRVQRDSPAIEQRFDTWTGLERRHVTGSAPDGVEHQLASPHPIVNGATAKLITASASGR